MARQRVCPGCVRDEDVSAIRPLGDGVLQLIIFSTPFMLDSYEAEYDEMCRAQNKHALELDQLRNANRSLSTQV